MPNDAATYYFTQGVLGVTVVVLAYVCVKFYNKMQELQDKLLEREKEITKDVTAVLAANTQSNLLLAEKIEAGKRGR